MFFANLSPLRDIFLKKTKFMSAISTSELKLEIKEGFIAEPDVAILKLVEVVD